MGRCVPAVFVGQKWLNAGGFIWFNPILVLLDCHWEQEQGLNEAVVPAWSLPWEGHGQRLWARRNNWTSQAAGGGSTREGSPRGPATLRTQEISPQPVIPSDQLPGHWVRHALPTHSPLATHAPPLCLSAQSQIQTVKGGPQPWPSSLALVSPASLRLLWKKGTSSELEIVRVSRPQPLISVCVPQHDKPPSASWQVPVLRILWLSKMQAGELPSLLKYLEQITYFSTYPHFTSVYTDSVPQ